MNLEGAYDSTTLDLDQCLMENKTRHRSPIIHLPEIFMYGYEFKDVLECANNFKSCSLDRSDDPVVNTVKYYSQKYDGKIDAESLDTILDIIYEHAYAIFHIDKDGTTYLASVKEDADDICIDSVCLQWNQMPDQNCDVRILWSKHNKSMNFEKFSKEMFDKFHSDDYQMNKSLKKILDVDQDTKDRFNKMPTVSYAIEETAFESFEFDDELFDLSFDDLAEEKENEFVLSVATEAPGDDGLGDLENMSGGGNATRQARHKRARRSSDPIGDLENMSEGDTPEAAENNKRAQSTDDTPTGRSVDVAQMTNDRMQETGDTSSEDQLTDDNAGGGEEAPAPDEGGEEGEDAPADEENPDDAGAEDEGEDPGETDDAAGDEESEDEDNTKLLNDPESKETYRKRFIALYKHINDVIDTLENFTPAYDMKCTNDYYTIQNDMYRLRTAIYKICTERIKDMQTVDVMNAYLTANYAYDSIGEMLKEFFKHYRTERMHNKK